MGRTIEEALARARGRRPSGTAIAIPSTCSARRRAPTADAERYHAAYRRAIAAIGKRSGRPRRSRKRPGISVKLSALHPRYEMAQRDRVMRELLPSLLAPRRRGPRRSASASRSMPRKPTGSNCRSILSRRWRWPPSSPAGTGSASRCRPIRSGRSAVIDWLADLARRARPPADGAAGQGRLLGQRDQARAGARPRRLPGIHAQGRDRRLLSRLRQTHVRRRRRVLSAIRDAQRPHPRRDPRIGAAGEAIGSSSACTAWARRSMRRSSAPTRWTARAGSMRRSAATRICSPIWCAGCWKTAPIPRSSTASSTSASRSTRSSPTRSRGWRACRRSRIRASRCRAICSGRCGRIRRASTSPIRAPSPSCATGLPRRCGGRGMPAPIVGGASSPAAVAPVVRPERPAPPGRHCRGRSAGGGRGGARPRRARRAGLGPDRRPRRAPPPSSAPPISTSATAPS